VDFELRDFETPAVSGEATVPVTIDLLTAISRELLYRLLTSEQGARLRQIISLGNQSKRTAKAIAWLKANFQKTLRAESLAEYPGWQSQRSTATFAP
jgi:transcriptional regulator GlxA family with amidase domain